MNTLKALSLIMLVSCSLAAVCKVYECTTFTDNDTYTPKCADQKPDDPTNHTVQYQQCDFIAQICPANVGGAGATNCEDLPAPYKRLPGDICVHDEECLSTSCNQDNHECVGLDAGKSCDNNVNICKPGYYCGSKNTCENELALGGSCDASKYGCPFFSECHSDICTAFFTLATGTSIDDNHAFLCKSGFADGETKKMKCAVGPILTGTRTQTDVGFACEYKQGAIPYDGITSKCGFNTSPTSYCPFMGGDLAPADYDNFSEISTSKFACSGLYGYHAQFGFKCAALKAASLTVKDALKKVFFLQNEFHYSMVQDNSDCIKNSSIFDVNNYHQFIAGDGTHVGDKKNPNVKPASSVMTTVGFGVASFLAVYLF
jgi:hypothetical protein